MPTMMQYQIFDDVKSDAIFDVYISIKLGSKLLGNFLKKITKDSNARSNAKSCLCCSNNRKYTCAYNKNHFYYCD